jgi:hypothetical protein
MICRLLLCRRQYRRPTFAKADPGMAGLGAKAVEADLVAVFDKGALLTAPQR